MNRNLSLGTVLVLLSTACSDVEGEGDGHDHHHHDHNHGLATSLYLDFTPQSGGETLSFAWSDPENDGSPSIDSIVLADGETYDVSVEVWNELEDPAEEVTPEIAEYDDEHQFFFTGDAVQGPATGENTSAIVEHGYADTDGNGDPVGIDNTFASLATGSGSMTVTLRHLPPEGRTATKTSGMADEVATGGLDSIAGDNDIQVEFPVTVE